MRRLGYEHLEERRVLAAATDLSLISGRIFSDLTGNGFNAGEEVAGATVNLYRDDGDGNFEPGTGDTLVTTAVSGADGRYRFSGLTAAGYFVQQPAQAIGGRTLAQAVSLRINISAIAVQGRLITTIDTFDTTTQLVIDDSGNGTPVTNTVAAAEAIGGERDLLVNKTSANGTVQISVNNPGLPGLITFDSILSGQGQWNISWDGVDGNAQVINDNGLAGLDITSGGTATGLQFQIGADVAGGQATIRVYSNDSVPGAASRFSSTNLLIPATGGAASSFEYIPFSAFAATSGGGANFAQIGAIEMEITGPPNINGAAELVGAVGPTIFTPDFSNFQSADLSLTKTVSNATPSTNENFTFTITVNNSGPNNATGVVVTDLLPAGLNFVSATASQGTYNNTTGFWAVGSVANAGSASLQIVANATTPGAKVNTAQITAADQTDPDSTPNNNASTEDDQATATVTPAAIDLSLAKSLSNPTPRTGDNITYAITVSNAGPSGATGVVVSDPLPTGVAFVSATPSQGTFNSATGVWTVGSIANAGSATLSLVGRVTGTGTITNVAQVIAADQTDINSTPNNNNPAENDQASTTFTIAVADLSLNKAVNNPTANVGENVTFTVTLSNAGPSTATGVSVRDQLPAGLTFISSTPSQGTYDAGTGIWQVGSVNATANATLQLVARVDALGAKTNVAEVIASDQFDNDSTPNNNVTTEDDRAAVSLTPASADLSLTKVVNDATPNVGQNVTFTITVSNAGPNAATGISLRDQLPAETTFVSATASAGTYNQATGIWTIGNLDNGSNATLQLVAVANVIGLTTNVAEIITADQFDPDSTPGNNVPGEDDQASVPLTVYSPSMSLQVLVNGEDGNATRGPFLRVGSLAEFTYVLTNTGNVALATITLQDDNGTPNNLLDDLLLDAPSPTFFSGDTNSDNRLDPDERWTYTLLRPAISGQFKNVGRASGTAIDSNGNELGLPSVSADDVSNYFGIQSDVTLTMQVNGSGSTSLPGTYLPANSNAQLTYLLTNNGNVSVGNLILYDYDGSSDNASDDFNPNQKSGDLNQNNFLDVGETWIYEVDQVVAPGLTTRTAHATGNLFYGSEIITIPPSSAPETIEVTATSHYFGVLSEIVVEKQRGETGNIYEQRPVTFDYLVTNPGNGPLKEIVVRDDNGTPADTADDFPPKYHSGDLNEDQRLDIGEIWRYQAERIAVLGQATSTARVSAIGLDGLPVFDDDILTLDILPVIDLELTLTIDNAEPLQGTSVFLTVTVVNKGFSDATDVVVANLLPPGLTFISAGRSGFDPVSGTWNVGEVRRDDVDGVSIWIEVRVDTLDELTAAARISHKGQFDANPANNYAQRTIKAQPSTPPQSPDVPPKVPYTNSPAPPSKATSENALPNYPQSERVNVDDFFASAISYLDIDNVAPIATQPPLNLPRSASTFKAPPIVDMVLREIGVGSIPSLVVPMIADEAIAAEDEIIEPTPIKIMLAEVGTGLAANVETVGNKNSDDHQMARPELEAMDGMSTNRWYMIGAGIGGVGIGAMAIALTPIARRIIAQRIRRRARE